MVLDFGNTKENNLIIRFLWVLGYLLSKAYPCHFDEGEVYDDARSEILESRSK